MAGFQPVVTVDGQLEQVGDRRCEVLRLNIGPAVSIFVTTTSFTVTTGCHRIFNNTGSDIQVTNILGGTEGDVVVLLSATPPKKVILKEGANFKIDGDFDFKAKISITLYRGSTQWEELART